MSKYFVRHTITRHTVTVDIIDENNQSVEKLGYYIDDSMNIPIATYGFDSMDEARSSDKAWVEDV